MRGGINKTTSKSGGKKVAKGIALLHDARDQTSCSFRAVLKGRCSNVSVQPTHCNAKECTAGQELLISLAESGAEFEDDEEKVVYNERPLSSVSVGSDTECDGAN